MEMLPRVASNDVDWTDGALSRRAAVAVRTASARVASIERLRLFAMFEIVAFHTRVEERLPIVGGLGLPLFLVLSTAFSAVSADRRDARHVLRSKLRYVGVAWLFWCAIYALHDVLRAVHQGRPIGSVFDPAMLFYGPTVHLWFAPFAIFAGSAAAVAYERTRSARPASRLWAALLIGVAYGMLLAPWVSAPVPIGQWAFAFPSIFLGFALGVVMLAPPGEQWWRGLIAVPLLLFALLAGPHLEHAGGDSLRRFALAFAIVVAALALPGRMDRVTRSLAPYMLGVYFVHVLVHDIGLALFAPNLTRALSHGETIVVSVLVYAGSLAVVVLMSRTPLARFVRVGGSS